jgi:hypothetical protein
MVRYKIVFNDREIDKCLFGEVEFEGPLIKVLTERGNIVYVNKNNIIFMKELRGDARG